MEAIETKSTSRNTASVSCITLRETKTTRLLFEPAIIQNAQNPSACVNGHLVFQKKGLNDNWKSFERLRLSTLKKGDEVRLEMHSAELLQLHKALGQLYELHRSQGVPMGARSFVQLPELLDGDGDRASELLSRLLAWVATQAQPNLGAFLERFEQVNLKNLQSLNTLLGVSALKNALRTWNDNLANGDEEFWQRTFRDQAFLLAQLFSYPVLVIKGKAYVGGKSVLNEGGNVVDFLLANELTRNAALLEIKTPTTKLLNAMPYRRAVYNPSIDLGGSVVQVLNYKQSVIETPQAREGHVKAWDPPCLVIIGNASSELTDDDMRKSFELFRARLHGVQLITFDELFTRTERFIELLERGEAPPQSPSGPRGRPRNAPDAARHAAGAAACARRAPGNG